MVALAARCLNCMKGCEISSIIMLCQYLCFKMVQYGAGPAEQSSYVFFGCQFLRYLNDVLSQVILWHKCCAARKVCLVPSHGHGNSWDVMGLPFCETVWWSFLLSCAPPLATRTREFFHSQSWAISQNVLAVMNNQSEARCKLECDS